MLLAEGHIASWGKLRRGQPTVGRLMQTVQLLLYCKLRKLLLRAQPRLVYAGLWMCSQPAHELILWHAACFRWLAKLRRPSRTRGTLRSPHLVLLGAAASRPYEQHQIVPSAIDSCNDATGIAPQESRNHRTEKLEATHHSFACCSCNLASSTCTSASCCDVHDASSERRIDSLCSLCYNASSSIETCFWPTCWRMHCSSHAPDKYHPTQCTLQSCPAASKFCLRP